MGPEVVVSFSGSCYWGSVITSWLPKRVEARQKGNSQLRPAIELSDSEDEGSKEDQWVILQQLTALEITRGYHLESLVMWVKALLGVLDRPLRSIFKHRYVTSC